MLLVGGGGHCRACIDVIESTDRYCVQGIVQPAVDGLEPVLGYPILGTDEDLAALLKQTPQALITVGQIKSPDIRIRLYERLKQLDAQFPVIMARSAHCSRHAWIGEGSILMHGAILNAGASVGASVIINTMALIEHDADIGPHCHISTGARINGGVRIGSRCFIGSGAVLRDGITIGASTIIGAGQIVLRDVPAGTILR